MTHALSSNVESFGYDADAAELWVGYRNTPGFYVYEGVPVLIHRAMLAAESKGSFLHQNVLHTYPVRHEA